MTFKHIIFENSILETDLKKIHINNLKIASENLIELNKRNPGEIDIEYKYHERESGYFGKKSFEFDRINTTGYGHYSDSYFFPGWIAYASRNIEKFDEWTKNFCNRIYNGFERNKNLYGIGEIELFEKLFHNFYPQGDFLNESQIEKFKNKINLKCSLARSYK